MTDEEILRSLFEASTSDLRAPKADAQPGSALLHLPTRPQTLRSADLETPQSAHPRRPRADRPPRFLMAGLAAAAGAAVAAVAILGFGAGAGSSDHSGGTTTASPAMPPATPTGPAALYQLASAVRALPSPTGRYAVQIEQQSEGSVSYLRATVIDSRTGDTWTYQHGPDVPTALPMVPAFSPTEAQLQASNPTDPARLRAALIAGASAANPAPGAGQTPNDLAVTSAIDRLWNPLVQPALRAALVAVIASSPGITTDTHATDSRGRSAIEISYEDSALGVRLSVYLDPSTGTVLESSERPYTATADPGLAGSDVYLSQYWTDTPPTVDPLSH